MAAPAARAMTATSAMGQRWTTAPMPSLEPEESVLWVRPIVGGYVPSGEPGLPPYAFHLNEARARAISTEQLSFDGEVLESRSVGTSATRRNAPRSRHRRSTGFAFGGARAWGWPLPHPKRTSSPRSHEAAHTEPAE